MRTTAILLIGATSALGGCGSFIVDPGIRTYGYASESPSHQVGSTETTLVPSAKRSFEASCVKNAETASLMQNLVSDLDITGSTSRAMPENPTFDLPVAPSGLFILPAARKIPIINIEDISRALIASAD